MRELRRKDQELERVRQESLIEVERVGLMEVESRGLPSTNFNLYHY